MNAYVAGYLTQDGIANGAIYALMAVALVVVFSVTRTIFIAQGEFVSFAALSYGALLEGRVPGTVSLVLLLTIVAAARDIIGRLRQGEHSASVRHVLMRSVFPLAACAAAWAAAWAHAPQAIVFAATIALITALGPLLYRLVYAPLAKASVLVLLIVSVALHFALLGMGLYYFGPQGSRTPPLYDASFAVGGVPVQAQSAIIVAAALVFMLALYIAAERTLYGKALRAVAINPVGARLVGISGPLAGEIAFALAAFIGALSGVLVSAVTTIYYDTGFLLGLKGFVAAILGGLAAFPAAVLGALALGLLESFSSFFASAFKEVIVFSLIIPVLLLRSIANARVHGDEG